MDSIPIDFIERVTALWRCCDDNVISCKCVSPKFKERKWKFPRTRNATVYINLVDGEWEYSFHIRRRVKLALEELLRHPNFNKMRIDSVSINANAKRVEKLKLKPVREVGMERLLTVISILANEPYVWLSAEAANRLSCPEGTALLNWLQERWFSSIAFEPYHSIYNRILQKQFLRRTPALISVSSANEDPEFFAAQLISGQITRLYVGVSGTVFTGAVMEGIVHSFLQAINKKKVQIYAYFDEATSARLRKMAEDGLGQEMDGKFIFENPFHQLEISNFTARWKCTSV